MKRIKRTLAYLLLVVVVVAGCGMATMSEELTWGRVDTDVVAYNEEAGTGTAADYKGLFYPSLASVRLLHKDFKAAVVVTKQELRHLVEQKNLQADILGGVVAGDEKVAAAREDFLFNPTTGVLAIGLGLIGMGGAGYLGLMRKRPKDITPADMEAALVTVKGELDEQDRSIIQLVAGIKNVLADQPTDMDREAMKKILDATQTAPETKTAVKQALAKL